MHIKYFQYSYSDLAGLLKKFTGVFLDSNIQFQLKNGSKLFVDYDRISESSESDAIAERQKRCLY